MSITVYTDGCCINNGKPNAKAGIGIYFGNNDNRNISKRVIGKQTNNVAELSAMIETYKILQKEIDAGVKITIYSDSIYAIRCCTTYGKKQKAIGWRKVIPNKELVRKAYDIFSKYDNIEFEYIKAHTNNRDVHSIGNQMADKLANESIFK